MEQKNDSVIICLGGASSVWDDFDKARSLCEEAGVAHEVGACNEAGADYDGQLRLWCTLHPENLWRWQSDRAREGRNNDYVSYSHKNAPYSRIDNVVPELWHGTSGLFVCRVAILELGFEKAIVCGMPMEGSSSHYFNDSPWGVNTDPYERGWREAAGSEELRGRIKSMSGWTAELVGTPTRAWLIEQGTVSHCETAT